jgi:serine/threonine-protein kinase
MSAPSADRNLLFGILALQLDFVGKDALIEAMNTWALDKTKPLGEILRDHGHLSADRLRLLSALVAEHLKQHDDDPKQSLAALRSIDAPVRLELQSIAEPALTAEYADAGAARPSTRHTIDLPVTPAGRYEILRPHAKGGLGEVFVAEDLELHRQVALKEIQARHADNPDSRARFVLEAEITGGLEHPGIVPVYGLGSYPDGRPYYAMRFVKGDNLHQALKRFHAAGADFASLAFRQLLRRFVDMCNAVAYAHSRGVLHRDLKPGNVMLGRYGETLVVDWGLAKVVGRESVSAGLAGDEPTLKPGGGNEPTATVVGNALGTIPYMSPEQAAGRLDELGSATDVYSLGATLFELLTGQVAFQTGDLDGVQKGLFLPPRRVTPSVPRALEAACLKAMALKPGDRYPTALALAAEVERWLADEPVTAWREPARVRARRWMKRHRVLVSGAAAFLLTAVAGLSVGAGLLWHEQQRTAAEKRHAEQEWARAEDNLTTARTLALNLLNTAETQLSTLPRMESVRREMTDTALRTFQQFLQQRPDDPELRERTAQIYRYSANVHRLLNDLGGAMQSFDASIQLLEALVAQVPEALVYRDRLAETWRDYSQLSVKAGRLGDAAVQVRRSLELAESLRAGNPDRPDYQRTVATALLNLAGIEYSLGQFANSAESGRRAAEHFRELVELRKEPAHPTDHLFLVAALNRQAVAERDLGHIADALRHHEEALEQAKNLLGRRSDNNVQHFFGRALVDQGQTLAQLQDRLPEAEEDFGKAILIWDDLVKRAPQIGYYAEYQAIAYEARARLRAATGRADLAHSDLEKSRALLEELVRKSPDVPGYRGHLGRTYGALGKLASSGADSQQARPWFERACEALRAALERSPENALDRRSLEEFRAELK